MTSQTIYLATICIIPVLVAITFHEAAAQGLAAHLIGHDTAWRLGRVSLNPLKHIDPVGVGDRSGAYSAGTASGIASCGAVRSSKFAGARLSPKRNIATIK
jgi:Zn-dependent protease